MDCFLFWVPFASGTGRHIRPVAWADPDILLEPMWLVQTPEAVAWLHAYGDPEWNSFFNRRRNAEHLHAVLGYWPPPINVAVTPVPDLFNDPIGF